MINEGRWEGRRRDHVPVLPWSKIQKARHKGRDTSVRAIQVSYKCGLRNGRGGQETWSSAVSGI